MADVLYFSRDTKVFIELGSTVWEIPVLDGFSFSQGTNTSEVTLSEMTAADGTSRRARQMFTDSYAPAEWSFSTYVRPFKASGAGNADDTANNIHAVEEALWNLLVANGEYEPIDQTFDEGLTSSSTALDIDFVDSNKSVLGTCNIYFVMAGKCGATVQDTIYKVSGCCVNEASIDFDIDGIASISWSGFGSIISEAVEPTVNVNEGVTDTDNFIRNRITNLALVGVSPAVTYDVVLTGGNITISNNMTFLTPETLGQVNQPLGHITGTRAISGNFMAYLNSGTNSTADLFENLIEDTGSITNSYSLIFNIGGSAANTPRLQFTLPTCHLEVPSHSIEDVISVETNFTALPDCIDATNELSIKYLF